MHLEIIFHIKTPVIINNKEIQIQEPIKITKTFIIILIFWLYCYNFVLIGRLRNRVTIKKSQK